jgi:hypothetical protein
MRVSALRPLAEGTGALTGSSVDVLMNLPGERVVAIHACPTPDLTVSKGDGFRLGESVRSWYCMESGAFVPSEVLRPAIHPF